MTAQAEDECLAFNVEWKDALIGITRKFLMRYWPSDNSVALLESNHTGKIRVFLKRLKVRTLRRCDLVQGRTITVMSRQLRIVGWADKATERKARADEESVTMVIEGKGAIAQAGQVLDRAFASNPAMNITFLKSTLADAEQQVAVCVAIKGKGARGVDWTGLEGVTLIPPDKQAQMVETFKRMDSSRAEGGQCVLAIVKPHTISEGSSGAIVQELVSKSGFAVGAIQSRQLDEAQALQLMAVYKGVLPEYRDLCSSLLMGTSIGIQLCGVTPEQVRQFLGPRDPAVAQFIAEQSVRAKYGQDAVNNAVQCTDLPGDAAAECLFWFAA